MNARKHIRNLLLVFAVGSLLYFFGNDMVDRRTGNSGKLAPDSLPGEIGESAKLIVYYFAEGKDCSTCLSIPLYTKAALETYFADELASGAIVWRIVNVEEARNAHFITEYSLYTKSVVLVRVNNGKSVRWKNLDNVWDLVYDKTGFVEYIRNEIREDLDSPP